MPPKKTEMTDVPPPSKTEASRLAKVTHPKPRKKRIGFHKRNVLFARTMDAPVARRRSRKAPRSRALAPLLAAVRRAVGPTDKTTADLIEAYCEVVIRGAITFGRKQRDYGPGNIAGGGGLGVAIRARDKVERLINLSGQTAVNESKVDSADDLHVYGGILALVLAGRWPGVSANPRLAL